MLLGKTNETNKKNPKKRSSRSGTPLLCLSPRIPELLLRCSPGEIQGWVPLLLGIQVSRRASQPLQKGVPTPRRMSQTSRGACRSPGREPQSPGKEPQRWEGNPRDGKGIPHLEEDSLVWRRRRRSQLQGGHLQEGIQDFGKVIPALREGIPTPKEGIPTSEEEIPTSEEGIPALKDSILLQGGWIFQTPKKVWNQPTP